MRLGELIYSLEEMQAVVGEDVDVEIAGAYASSGDIFAVSFDGERSVVQINSDIMSG